NEQVHLGGATYLDDSPSHHRNAYASYDVSHARPWNWQVPAYCWTKGIGSGALAIPAIAMAAGWLHSDRLLELVLSTLALVFTALTVLLLVWDLDRPERFLRVLLTPQSKSWLVRGAFILIAYSLLTTLLWLAVFAGLPAARSLLLWPVVIAGVLSAMYTAF